MKNGGIETPGTKVNVLGRTKLRTQDAFFTLPDPKHRENVLTLLNLWHSKPSRVAGERKPRTESNTQPVDEQRAELYAKCVGSLICSSIDRKDIRFETKELARHMRGPREVDWSNLIVLAQYLLHKPDFARVTCLNAESKASGVLTVDRFTDSDWGGCLDTRRSTDCSLINVGTVVIAHPQTQPGTPASSSGEAETRALSRGARDIMFIKQLAEEVFFFELPECEPRSQLSVLPRLTTTRLLRLSGPQRQAALPGGGFEVEQGVQKRPFVGFGLQCMHPRAA